jgi:hypothetical protein
MWLGAPRRQVRGCPVVDVIENLADEFRIDDVGNSRSELHSRLLRNQPAIDTKPPAAVGARGDVEYPFQSLRPKSAARAVAFRAALNVTGDAAHLLPIGSRRGIAIVTARDVLDLLSVRGF